MRREPYEETGRCGTEDEIRQGLDVCSVWVKDENGEMHKDCPSCPYRDPEDPAGMECGERLMRDAGVLIDQLRARYLSCDETEPSE